MKLGSVLRWGAPALAAGLLIAATAYAQDAAAPAAAAEAAPTVNKGDTTWMMISSVLVLLMTIPGLALFYGGLVRAKNMLSVLMQVSTIACLMMVVWVIYGYSLAFGDGGAFIGDFSKVFLAGITPDSTSATFTKGVAIPEYVFVCFQMTFAAITPGLIIGGFAERIKFSAAILFAVLWGTFVYFPVAHMVWSANGMVFGWGGLDFAGGTVVHINSGVAALVGAILLGKRTGYGKDIIAPHNLPMTLIGAGLLWVGWFGFNAGSNLEANGVTTLALLNTFVATAAAGLVWMFVEWGAKGKPSMLGLASGVVAGLVAITPAAGLSGPMGAMVLGGVAAVVCFIFCTSVKNALGYDDSLDVFGIHGIGGIIGAIGTGIVVSPDLGGVGVADYTMAGQVLTQIKAVAVTVVWTGVGSLILFKIVDVLVGLRVTVDAEQEGLDIISHGEQAYHAS
ncbi:ammonium transporter [Hansschlegelia plantiphila]|uniref:Ammonium transporter n=1 Tax=Hansschlegelia plantiphila TaxID=374655 RepID=A0A9W6J3M5_9HYPH|nr:ammonium transporter [Hansschlegelia plantiphila]GLK68690.1 ammonium transporter [Hansschlegelia plantiphila]